MPKYSFDPLLAADLVDALANCQRFKIVSMLRDGEMDVKSITAELDMAQSAVSQHLKKLRDTKVLKTRRDAQTIFYSVANRSAITLIDAAVEAMSSPPTTPSVMFGPHLPKALMEPLVTRA
ncbi:ArsR/SmtB family transcription factor [Agrobacterium pusense]|uniref:ArsR/SmtB family transcription factor n=1 Tax=Agrobacterium pusense TaxID=648995 RepID=UPI000D1AC2DD|nr:metalloregulator ArsR/SmtB family transcription factor [Agrobacterium pusense]